MQRVSRAPTDPALKAESGNLRLRMGYQPSERVVAATVTPPEHDEQ